MMTAGSEHIATNEFRLWLEAANPGDRIVYLTGFLAKSLRDAGVSKDPNLGALVSLGAATWEARDRVCLVQRRLEPLRFEYIAVAKSNGVFG